MSERVGPRGWAARDGLLALPAVGAAIALARGHVALAAVVGLLAVVGVTARVAVGPAVHEPVVRAMRRLERAIAWAGGVVVWCVFVAPAGIARAVGGRLRRLVGRGEPRDGGWVDAGAGGAPRSRGSLVLQVVGLVLVVLVADVLVGVAWQRATRSEAAQHLGLGRDGTHVDERASSPALAGDPWAEGQLRDLQRLPQAYWPFTNNRPLPFASETVNVDGWDRRSYEPKGASDRLPVVAFFGGSTMFGEGQRDERTIASDIARLAEEAGTPIRVVNYGQRAWASWQEAMLFDQLTSDPTDPDFPDLVVFYDGWNEVDLQRQRSTSGWPTIFGVDGVSRSLTGQPAGSGAGSGFRSRSFAGEAWDWYKGRSMLARVARGVRSAVSGDGDRPSLDLRTDDDQVGRDAASIYLRAVDVATSTAQRRGIESAFFWQPGPEWRRNRAFARATSLVEGKVTVIADALDEHQDVYFDQIHTNEAGARIVAERMWETLGPKVARLG